MFASSARRSTPTSTGTPSTSNSFVAAENGGWTSASSTNASFADADTRRRRWVVIPFLLARARRNGITTQRRRRVSASAKDALVDDAEVQPPFSAATNEFEVLGVPVDVGVDLRALEANMRALQRRLHPDKFAQASAEERLRAEEASSRVNTSYAVVKDPLLRANRAISLKLGRDVLNEEALDVDMELLMEVMEVREAVEETEDLEALHRVKAENNAKMRATHSRVIDHYRRGDYDAAAKELIRLQYYSKIRTEIFAVSQRRNWDLHVCAVPII
mmetsp:Transcript_30552/g.93390  ORF Transcript_30552/g.93390 Transcript_30552/m.93390 type:complete len:274 (-) Transcript_30552:39-860(-)